MPDGREADVIAFRLTALPFLETTFAVWRRTGEVSFGLRRRGVALPLSDLIIAAAAMEHRCRVYTLDPHFALVANLSLHTPTGASRR